MIAVAAAIAGLVLLVLGGDVVVRGASGIATWARVPTVIVGTTIVAGGTSAPELVVSLVAALEGSPELAFGNVVGSNLYNIGLVLAIAALILPCVTDPILRRLELPTLCVATLALGALAWDGRIGRIDGAVLCLGGVFYLAASARRAAQLRITTAVELPPSDPIAHAAGFTIGGLICLTLGAQLLVHGATTLAHAIGIPERIIGLTMVAVGTSLPELFASSLAAWRGDAGVAVGNVVGSNILNIVCIVGPVSLLATLDVQPAMVRVDWAWMMMITGVLAARLLWTRPLGRLDAAVLGAIAAWYSWLLLGSIAQA